MKGFNKRQPVRRKSFHSLISQVTQRLKTNYISDELAFGKRVINNIIYNEKSHCVAGFKDFLILDDATEFLKRFYSRKESKERLPHFFDYYETYSRIFPNYTSILEGKYIYHNIQKKQKMIDMQERIKLESKKRHTELSDEVFSTDVYDSIINDRNNEDLEAIFNVNELSFDFTEKVSSLIADIEKNGMDNQSFCYNHNNQSNSIHGIRILSNEKPAVSTHKMLLSSLPGKNKYCKSKNGFIQRREKPIFISFHNSCDSNGDSKKLSKVPLTDRLSSKNKLNDNYKEQSSNQVSKPKVASAYPKTILIDNGLIQKGRMKEDLDTLLTQGGNYKHKASELTLIQLKEFNEKKIKSLRMHIKTPPKFSNNFNYMVNQHPKITTHATLNNNSSISSTRNTVNTQQLTGRTNSNAASKVSSKRPSATFKSQRSDCLTARTRNTKPIINHNLMLKTARGSGGKNLHLIKTASQPSMPFDPNEKFYTTKYAMKNRSRPASTSQTRGGGNHQPNKFALPQKKELLRKRMAPCANQSVYQLPKKKQMVKGIPINNFSKVFSINCSQATSDRLDMKYSQR